MKDISNIIETELMLDVGSDYTVDVTIGHKEVEKLKSIAKSIEKVSVGSRNYPIVIKNIKSESVPGRKTADVRVTFMGVEYD